MKCQRPCPSIQASTTTLFVLLSLTACSEDNRGSSGAVDDAGNGKGNLDTAETETGPPSDDEGMEGIKLDVNMEGESNGDESDDGGPTPDVEIVYSHIWIANSPEGTVSKIDTIEAVELSRYITGPDRQMKSPSRTSVNLYGDVAVANRHGGEAAIIKIASKEEDCVDRNDDGTIQTGTGQGLENALPWGEDECVIWQHDLEDTWTESNNAGGPRAVAWDAHWIEDPDYNPDPDTDVEDGKRPDPRVWVGWRHPRRLTRFDNTTSVFIRRLDGKTGELQNEVEIDGWNWRPWGHGPYGGAVDGDGSFWISGASGELAQINPDFEVRRFTNPMGDKTPYGMTLDAEGNPWVAGFQGELHMFNRDTETFENAGNPCTVECTLRGLAIDAEGHAWVAAHANGAGWVARYDTINREVVDGIIELPNALEPVGISIDIEGNAWVVDKQGDDLAHDQRNTGLAFRVNPNDYDDIEVIKGLVNPYTYSDMTGGALRLIYPPIPENPD